MTTPGVFRDVWKAARGMGLRGQLKKFLRYLHTCSGDKDPRRTRCLVQYDWAPLPFGFLPRRSAFHAHTLAVIRGSGSKRSAPWEASSNQTRRKNGFWSEMLFGMAVMLGSAVSPRLTLKMPLVEPPWDRLDFPCRRP